MAGLINRFLTTVQQRIGFLVSVVGIVVLIDNIIHRYIREPTFLYVVGALSVWLLFLMIIPFIFSIFVENKSLKIVQVTMILFMGILNILDAYNEIYGPGMFLAGWLLMRHYGFVERYQKTKYVLLFITLIGLSQISAIVHNQGAIDAGMGTLQYSAFIIIFVVIIWRDMVLEQERLKVENRSLKINYTRIRDQLKELEEEQKPYNLKTAKISPAEERVIKTLTIFKASNREIAERLNIAEPTVKLHLYNIYNKIGVDNRFAIIDLCKYNYIQNA